jgi:CBS domain-containing membrane protein
MAKGKFEDRVVESQQSGRVERAREGSRKGRVKIEWRREYRVPEQMQVAELMSNELVTLTEDETLAHAENCMARGRIRHLPVVRDGKLVGLVTHRDLLASSFSIFADVKRTEQRRVFARISAGELMHRDVVTVRPDTLVADAAKTLLKNKYGCLPVVDEEGVLVGMITEADFLHLTVRLLQ